LIHHDHAQSAGCPNPLHLTLPSRQILLFRISRLSGMAGSSPLRNGLTLAQRFAYKPPESRGAASSIGGSASKRRRLDGDFSARSTRAAHSSSASASPSTNAPQSPDAHSSNAVKVPATGPASTSEVGASSGGALSAIANGKKRAASPGADHPKTVVEPSSLVAEAFAASLSDAELPGVGGELSETQLLELECNTLHPSWLEPLRKE
jgi:hypothetical protein